MVEAASTKVKQYTDDRGASFLQPIIYIMKHKELERQYMNAKLSELKEYLGD